MNYNTLLSTTYQNLMDCENSEIEYYRSIADNLLELKKENHVTVNVGNSIENYAWNTSLDLGLSELEFNMLLPRYKLYLSKGFSMQDAYDAALREII
jgi:hypothetical protein